MNTLPLTDDRVIMLVLVFAAAAVIVFAFWLAWNEARPFGTDKACEHLCDFRLPDGMQVRALRARKGATPLSAYALAEDRGLRILHANECLRARAAETGIENWSFVVAKDERGDYERLNLDKPYATHPLSPSADIEGALILTRKKTRLRRRPK